MTLGQRIKKARVEAGMTQLDLALKVGARERYVQRWEHDVVEPSAKFLLPLVTVLPDLGSEDSDKRAWFNALILSSLHSGDVLAPTG